MDFTRAPDAICGIVFLVLLAGCLSGGSIGEPQSPSSSPTQSAPSACVDGVSFYGLESPGETLWASDRIAIGYTLPANASILFVAFEDGNVIGTTHDTNANAEYGVAVDGNAIPLDRPASGSHMIRVRAYTDTNHNGQFDRGTDQACRRDGQPVEAGPRRINFSRFDDPARTPTTVSTPSPDDVIDFEALPPEAQQEFITALEEDGVAECEIALLAVEQPIINYQGDFYTYAVQSGSGGTATKSCDTDFLSVEKYR